MNRLYTSKIVTHHSVTPQDWDMKRTVDLILLSHKQRGLAYDGNIAYHFLIGKDWTYQGRPINSVGYHAGNWLVNLSSVAICLAGNFNVDKPTKYQEKELVRLVNEIKCKYSLKNEAIKLHREIHATACPGMNITNDYILGLLSIDQGTFLSRVNEALKLCGDDPNRSVGTLTVSKWWQNRVVKGEIKDFADLVNKIKWHQQNHKYPHNV